MTSAAFARPSLRAVPSEPALYRKVLGHVPTPVCVVTASAPAGPVGVTVGSFTSVSLDPPLVVFYCGSGSVSAPAVIEAGSFCVNVLSEDQDDLGLAFAGRSEDRFSSCSWRPGVRAAPQIEGASAWIDCVVEGSFPAADHVAILGRVTSLAADGHRRPLIFYRGGMTRLDRASARHVHSDSFAWWSG